MIFLSLLCDWKEIYFVGYILNIVGAVEEPFKINVKTDSGIELNCPANATGFFPSWTLLSSQETIERTLSAGSRINLADPLSLRIKLKGFKDGFFNLLIQNITHNDSGLYCCITFLNEIPKEFCTQLYVVGKYILFKSKIF